MDSEQHPEQENQITGTECQQKIRELREQTGLSRREFCERFEIPYRTVTEWELGHRNAPAYVLRFLEYYIQMEAWKQGEKSAADGENADIL